MNSANRVRTIPNGRRETGNRVVPKIIRRPDSSSDRRLHALSQGERGLPFMKTENCKQSHPNLDNFGQPDVPAQSLNA